MPRYLLVTHVNPVEGREDEYNDWYVNHHLPALLAIPGVVSARRGVVSETQMRSTPQPFKYLGLIEIETDSLQGFFQDLAARTASGQIPRSTSIAPDGSAVFWQVTLEMDGASAQR